MDFVASGLFQSIRYYSVYCHKCLFTIFLDIFFATTFMIRKRQYILFLDNCSLITKSRFGSRDSSPDCQCEWLKMSSQNKPTISRRIESPTYFDLDQTHDTHNLRRKQTSLKWETLAKTCANNNTSRIYLLILTQTVDNFPCGRMRKAIRVNHPIGHHRNAHREKPHGQIW